MPSQTMRIGLACNEGCMYCFADPELWADRPRGWGKDYSNLIGDDWRREMREIRRAGYDGLSLSGGEPMLHPELVKMVKYARLLGFERVELQTNATLLTEANARRLAKAGVCSALASMPSHVEKVYNAITATKGYFEPAVEGIRHLLRLGVRVTLAHVVCTANYRYLPEYVAWVADELPGLQGISFLYVQPEGRATTNASLYPALEDLRPFWRAAMEGCDRRGLAFKSDPQTGLPLCMMDGYEHHVPMDLLVDPESFWADDISSYVYMQSHKRHGSRCGECFFARVCYGFWNEYLDAYGDAGLVPVPRSEALEARFPRVAAGAEVPRLPAGGQVVPTRMLVRKGIRRVPAREGAGACGPGAGSRGDR